MTTPDISNIIDKSGIKFNISLAPQQLLFLILGLTGALVIGTTLGGLLVHAITKNK